MLRRLLGLGAPAAGGGAKPRAKAPPEEPPLLVHHEGRAIAVRVRRSASAKRVGLRVRAGAREAVLTLPARAGRRAAEAFARAQAGWIAARLERLAPAVPLLPGAVIPLRGAPARVVHDEGARGARVVAGGDGAGGGEALIVVGGHALGVPARALALLKREARADLAAAVARHAAALGVTVARVGVRDTTSRWGSCTASGALNFSWRLVLAPPFVLDYLAAHEVAHRAEMNHSERYWRVLRSLPVEVDAAEAWLKREGAGLHRYGKG